ncbi:hypothetical protein HY480_04675 [Candidatus Uhrbacteria bacterium]|nr:hypothetical protein [Candidatus Uhrbacteria bacterium]
MTDEYVEMQKDLLSLDVAVLRQNAQEARVAGMERNERWSRPLPRADRATMAREISAVAESIRTTALLGQLRAEVFHARWVDRSLRAQMVGCVLPPSPRNLRGLARAIYRYCRSQGLTVTLEAFGGGIGSGMADVGFSMTASWEERIRIPTVRRRKTTKQDHGGVPPKRG